MIEALKAAVKINAEKAAVKINAEKVVTEYDCDSALKYTQAALNAAHAMRVVIDAQNILKGSNIVEK